MLDFLMNECAAFKHGAMLYNEAEVFSTVAQKGQHEKKRKRKQNRTHHQRSKENANKKEHIAKQKKKTHAKKHNAN